MALKLGDKAPDLTIKDQDGSDVKFSSLKGKRIVLYFYPRDMTEGCTAQACDLRDHYQDLLNAGYEVLGVSTDDEKSHRKFIAKEKLPFRLLADPDKKLHDAYGTWIEKSMYGRKYMGTARVTFIIDENGIIEDIIQKVDTRNHANQILNPSNNIKPATSKAISKKSKAAPKKDGKITSKK
jgi:peroxiredoxin Q/BCP